MRICQRELFSCVSRFVHQDVLCHANAFQDQVIPQSGTARANFLTLNANQVPFPVGEILIAPFARSKSKLFMVRRISLNTPDHT